MQTSLLSATPMPATSMTESAGMLAEAALRSNLFGSPADDVVKIDLPHMNVVLSLSVETVEGKPVQPSGQLPAEFDADASDPVMGYLLRQLERSGKSGITDGIHSDALRLALIARWLGSRARDSQAAEKGAVHPLQKWRMRRVEAYVEEHLDETITLADLAKVAGLSRMHFAAQFRAATGIRPHDYLLRRRIERAKQLLADSGCSLVEIALDVGFQTQAHFTTVFKRFAGTTPARWRDLNRLAA